MEHNAIQYRPTYGTAIGTLIGAPESEVSRISETITPILNLEEIPEAAFLFGVRLCAGSVTVGAVAGEFGYAGLVNFATSGLIVIVEKMSFDVSAVVIADLLQNTEAALVATLLTTARGQVRDRRWPSILSQTLMHSGTDPSSSLGGIVEQRRSPGNASVDFTAFPFVLPPGVGLVVVDTTVNAGFTVNMVWRERRMLPGENQGPG